MSVRQLVANARTAWAMRSFSHDDRRAFVYGEWYREVQRIRASVPENASVDIVMADADARDVAVFAGAALAPRDCRFFAGWDAFRRRERALFLHDARAVNAPSAAPPPAANVVLVVERGTIRAVP